MDPMDRIGKWILWISMDRMDLFLMEAVLRVVVMVAEAVVDRAEPKSIFLLSVAVRFSIVFLSFSLSYTIGQCCGLAVSVSVSISV